MAGNPRKLIKELEALQKSGNCIDSSLVEANGFILGPSNPDVLSDPWHLSLLGPAGSLYAGGTFKFEITIPKDYPFNKEYPKVKFLTKIWHPLPTSLGDVCLGEVKWSPTDKLANVADLLRGLLLAPSADNAPASGGGGQGALEMFESDRAAFDAKAREWTHKYAGGPAPKGATPAKPAPPPDPYPAQTKQLVEMGFERALVLKCLEQAKGDVNGAMERLLSA